MDGKGCSDYISLVDTPRVYGFGCATQRVIRRCVTARMLLLGALLIVLGACHAQEVKSGTKAKAPVVGQTVMLTLHGYNYTDHYIDSYSVNGAGGGNLFVSSPTTGGGGGACCVRWLVGRALPVKVHIRWESSECNYTERVDGEDFPRVKSFYSETDVWIKDPVPADPQYFETHFYPDGHIEVAIADDYSPPRLVLPRTKHMVRSNVKDWPQCTQEQMREGKD